MTRALSTATLLMILPLAAANAQPRLVIDQSSPAAPPPIPFTFAIGGPSAQILAQTVTAGETGRLVEVRLPLACADGRLRLEIRDVDALGQPGPTLYRAREFPASRFGGPVTEDFRSLQVTGPVDFVAGDRFAIVLSNPSGSCGTWPGPVGDPYAGGDAWYRSPPTTTWSPLSIGTGMKDLAFETLVRLR